MKPSKSADSLVPGGLIAGKYRVERTIGEGGMGLIVRAVHLDLERRVAIKIIRDELAGREDMLARLLLEAKAVARLRSEHVARVLDVGRLDRGGPFIVMEYLEGKDLWTVLHEEGRLPPPLAVDYVVQACEALAEAHALGIVHRDVKPENLFRASSPDGAPIIKVLDFGISKHASASRSGRITGASVAVGSPHYMAPEQLRADPDVDARADIWALGVILYELVSGVSPFDADSLPKVCGRVAKDEPPGLCEIDARLPKALERVIFRCLSKERARRPATVAEVAELLAPFGTAETPQRAARVARILHGADARPTLPDCATARPTQTAPELTPSRAPTSLMPVIGSIFPAPPRPARDRAFGRYASAVAVASFALCVGLAAGVTLVASSRGPASAPIGRAAQASVVIETPARAPVESDLPRAVDTSSLALAAPPAAPPPARSARPWSRPERRPGPARTSPTREPVVTTTAIAAATVASKAASASIVSETSLPPPSVRPDAAPPREATSKNAPAPRPNAWDPRNFGGRR